jgi:hypothetical protein
MEDLLTCTECNAELPAPIDGASLCPRCGLENLSRTGEHEAITARDLPLERPSHAGEDAARIAMSEDSVLDLLRRHFGVFGTVSVAPNIPEKKEDAARRAHLVHLPEPERILALYDSSALGTGEHGFIITTRRLCWKNKSGGAKQVGWREIDPDRLMIDGMRLCVDDDALAIFDEDVIESCLDAFHILALSARPQVSSSMPVARDFGDFAKSEESSPSAWFVRAAEPLSLLAAKGTPPPPHSASYLGYAMKTDKQASPACMCWHCHTPLHATTPQCGYCGAVPKKSGWRKAG